MEYGNGSNNQLVWKTTENKYHNADFDVDENNVNVNVAILSKFVEPGDTVLDIGCGEGKFGIVLKNKQCNLYGVDIDYAACQGASESGYYKKIFCINIEQPTQTLVEYQEFLKENVCFDKIALIDILEHVVNPTAVINNVVKLLKDNGKILISIPNVNNGDILLNLMRDHFNYRDAGVLDNTHTKYFTKRSFVEWIEEINESYEYSLDCEYVGSTFGYTEYLEEIKVNKPYVYQFIQENPYFHVMQHLFVLSYKTEKDERRCPNLKSLLSEAEVDLSDILEGMLSDTMRSNNIKLLPNERIILEERCESSEDGWRKCAEELKNADKKIRELELELQKASSKIQIQEEELQNASFRIQIQETELQNACDYQKKIEIALEEARQTVEVNKETLKQMQQETQKRINEYDFLNLKYNECVEELHTIKNTKRFKVMEIINGKSRKS